MPKPTDARHTTKLKLKKVLCGMVDDFMDNNRHGNFQVNFCAGNLSNINEHKSWKLDDMNMESCVAQIIDT